MDNSIILKNYKLEDLDYRPAFFDNEIDGHGKLTLVDMYGVLFADGDDKPIWFIRHCNPDGIRFGAFHRPGNDYLDVQSSLHLDDIAQRGAKIEPYHLADDHYEISCREPFFEYKFYEDHVEYKETNVLDVRGDLFTKAIFKHADDSLVSSQITQSLILDGTYEGKHVRGLGNFELVYMPEKETRNLNDFFSYIYAYDAGIREDGKKEIAMINLSLNGYSKGFYWLEGENPVISDNVLMEAKWVKLPYVDDGTCIYKDAVFKFGGKEIHFKGKWGAKGLTAYPRVELSGQSQIFGTWYEGRTPYKHSMSITFHENMDVFADKLSKAGFEVID